MNGIAIGGFANDYFSKTREIGSKSVLYTKNIAKLRDPFTLPHTRTSCCKVEEILGVKFCTAWATEYQWYYVSLDLVVSTQPVEVEAIIDSCLQDAAIAGILSGIIGTFLTSGAGGIQAAIATFQKVLYDCISSKIGPSLIDVRVDTNGRWGDWESH